MMLEDGRSATFLNIKRRKIKNMLSSGIIKFSSFFFFYSFYRITEAYDEHQKLVKDMNSGKRKNSETG